METLMAEHKYVNNNKYLSFDISEDLANVDWYDGDFADEMYKRYRLNEPPFTNNLGVTNEKR